MSLSRSAGDIAWAINIAIKIVRALDESSGAANEYREATAFLQSLIHTLQTLQAFEALSVYPAHQERIRDQVEKIKQPIECFLESVRKFELDFAGTESGACNRHIVSKLKWALIASRTILILKRDIESHIQVLDKVLQLLIMYVAPQPVPSKLSRSTISGRCSPQ